MTTDRPKPMLPKWFRPTILLIRVVLVIGALRMYEVWGFWPSATFVVLGSIVGAGWEHRVEERVRRAQYRYYTQQAAAAKEA